MIAVDTNILVYAHRLESPWHPAAVRLVNGLAEGSARWLIPWPCIHEFIGIVTHSRVFKTPTPLDLALAQVNAWIASPSVEIAHESPTHFATLELLLTKSKTTGPAVHDARIAAICIDQGVAEILTADRNFSRFTDLKTRNPLV